MAEKKKDGNYLIFKCFVFINSFVFKFQIFIFESYPPLAKIVSVGLNYSDNIDFLCPFNSAINYFILISHNYIIPSKVPRAKIVPF